MSPFTVFTEILYYKVTRIVPITIVSPIPFSWTKFRFALLNSSATNLIAHSLRVKWYNQLMRMMCTGALSTDCCMVASFPKSQIFKLERIISLPPHSISPKNHTAMAPVRLQAANVQVECHNRSICTGYVSLRASRIDVLNSE